MTPETKTPVFPDLDYLEESLMPVKASGVVRKRRERLMDIFPLLEEYFGESDARIILALALAVKYPTRWGWLLQEIKKYLEEEP
ncbi:hypothetical protein [Hydrogenivirga sp.]